MQKLSDLPTRERCPECGMPDNCGDCSHQQLSAEELRKLDLEV